MHMTKSQFNALLDKKEKKKGNKFGAIKTEYKGRIFDSKKEAQRAFELDCMIRAGEVTKVEYQPKYEIVINGQKVSNYFGDFRVHYPDGRVEVEDVKGLKRGASYQIFRLKKKLVKALFGIEIIEI